MTRLIETGTPTAVTPFVAILPVALDASVIRNVPVKVPFGGPIGSAITVKSAP